ncbi:MAG: flagellar FlbD family protein [Deltaproteobacteria bacterium]|nr:flagellar FlbD family protein [Deltaproteobacteria bacterium]
MVQLTRLNHQEVIVNAAHIVTVEATPDTLLTLFGGEKLLVRETPAQVIELVVSFWRRINVVPHVVPPLSERVDKPEV